MFPWVWDLTSIGHVGPAEFVKEHFPLLDDADIEGLGGRILTLGTNSKETVTLDGLNILGSCPQLPDYMSE